MIKDHRAIALPDRVTIAHALHCNLIASDRHSDQETLAVLMWIVRRYGMHNISQAPFSLPIGVWRALDSVFPGEMILSERRAIRHLAQQFQAERSAAAAMDAINSVISKHPRP